MRAACVVCMHRNTATSYKAPGVIARYRPNTTGATERHGTLLRVATARHLHRSRPLLPQGW
jgi:hypothetical protein